MRQTIYLALTDDWELRGDGSGDMEEIQLRPMRELIRLYQRFGVRGTFNAELMQQLKFRELQDRHPELKAQADRWDEHVCEAYRQGQDIQLHLHTQWSRASYEDGRWRLAGDWSLTNYEPEESRRMLRAGKEYLENLLRAVDERYRCVAFRAGALAVAPSEHLLGLLVELGITLETSIVGGLEVRTRNLQLDYTACEEDFLPFYPRMEDARRVSDKAEKIVCVPIHHFYGSRRQVFRQILSLGVRKGVRRLKPARAKPSASDAVGSYAQQEWADERESGALKLVYHKAIRPCLKGKHLTSDFSRLNRAFVCEMLAGIRSRAAATGLEKIPVVLTNHSKYLDDFGPLESFLSEATQDRAIEFVTLAELASRLQAGEFYIRKADR